MSLLEMFCDVDDFCRLYEAAQRAGRLSDGRGKRGRKARLSLSEVLTILIAFHQSHYRDFKAYYLYQVCWVWRGEFPQAVSYSRFVELMTPSAGPLAAYLTSRFGQGTGLAFIDSTPLAVCHVKRIPRHKVFAGLAARAKCSMGWFFGFKLHLIVNDQGELLAVRLTAANVDDRQPVAKMAATLWGKLVGDKGYLSQPLFEQLYAHHLQLITPRRRNMAPALVRWLDKLLLRKRSLIETINDQLKNIAQIDHTRHRSPSNFVVNLLAALVAYTLQPKKPSLRWPSACSGLVPTHF